MDFVSLVDDVAESRLAATDQHVVARDRGAVGSEGADWCEIGWSESLVSRQLAVQDLQCGVSITADAGIGDEVERFGAADGHGRVEERDRDGRPYRDVA